MTEFEYQAREPSGRLVSGEIRAVDRRGALRELAGRGLFPSRLDERGTARVRPRSASPASASPASASLAAEAPARPLCDERETSAGTPASSRAPGPPAAPRPARSASPPAAPRPAFVESAPVAGRLPRRVSRKEVTAFTRELATLLGAAIPIPRALAGLSEQEENEGLRFVIDELSMQVRGGRSLSEAMESFPRLFPKLYTSMIRVGEESGALDKVLVDLADLLEREDEMRAEVLGATAYPAFVLLMGIATTAVLLTFVLPRLFGMLEDMADALPAPTRVLLALSRFLESYWIVALGSVAIALVLVRMYFRSTVGALRLDGWKLSMPVVGPVFRAATLARLARTLGTLTHAGVSLLPALEIVRGTVGNRRVSDMVAQAAEETRGGDSLAAPLRRFGVFPPTMVQMIAVGEETGRLDSMLLKIAAIQEKLLAERSRTLISLLAPALILVVGALVGFIVIALLLPIFRMSQAIR